MPDLIECEHPALPGQRAFLVKPWGDWRPVGSKKTSARKTSGTDSPPAGDITPEGNKE